MQHKIRRFFRLSALLLLPWSLPWMVNPNAANAAGYSRSTLARSHARLVVKPGHRSDTVFFVVSGKIAAPLAREIEQAFEKNKDQVRRIVLKLNSGGGSVAEGKRVIEVLQRIRATHELVTAVDAGRSCGSMCVFLYAQGHRRFAASASLWLFHEVSHKDSTTHRVNRLDRTGWLRLIDTYLIPAGVSPRWIADLKQHAFGSDYWRTGEALVRERSGLVLKLTSDEVKRHVFSNASADR